MKRKYPMQGARAALALLATAASPSHAETIVESAREIPVAYDVDVVVVGGGVGAVSAAVEAAEEGASVFLAAPRPYLGEDVAGTLRLWLESGEKAETPLEKSLFEREAPMVGYPNRVMFTYEADQPFNSKHADRKNTILSDGVWADPAKESVQYDEDVTVEADLGKMVRLEALHLMAFRREHEFEIEDVEVWTSPDGEQWRELGKIESVTVTGGSDADVHFALEVKQPCRYVKLLVRKAPDAERILLGELLLIEESEGTADAVAAPATPMQVKVALDDALLESGVKFLYGAMVTDVMRDESGQAAGVVMVNRAGRQAVKAKVVIDGTFRATAVRAAGAEFRAYPGGKQRFQRIVVGGEARAGKGVDVELAEVKFFSKEGAHDVFVYELEIEMPDDSAASFGRAEVLARERTFDVGLVDESDVLFQVPPDPMVAEAAAEGDDLDIEKMDLAALQPKGMERLYVLGGCAGVSRMAAERMLRPLAQVRLGKRVGGAAARKAASAVVNGAVRVFSMPPGDADSVSAGEVREFLRGVRPTHREQSVVLSPERALPVLGKYDVVIAGGGTGGAPAAIGAARTGGRTLVLEFQDHLGGVGTQGLISNYYHGYRKGFTEEVDIGLLEMGGPKGKKGWNPVAKREWWRNSACEAGADIWYSTLACGAVVREGKVVGVIAATPQGRGVVLARAVVDSTGNSDVAVAAGADFMTTSAEHVAMQGTGLSPRALGTGYCNTDYSFADESDPVDQWRMIIAGRQKYRDQYDISSFINTRERRRIVGDAFVSPLDIINSRTWSDTISLHQSNFDTHGYTVHPVFLIDFPDKKDMIAAVPYRALLPRGVDGIIVTGLGISAHRDSMPILRMQPCIQNQGYAAGVAAATIAGQNIATRELDVTALQKHLVEIGSLPPGVVGGEDSPRLSDDQIAAAVASVVDEYRGLAVLLEEQERAQPLLRKSLKKTVAPEEKLVYANILGMLGDSAGVPVLIETIKGQDWDEGWNFRGMGQFGGSISPMDSHIIALGRSGDTKGLPVILEKVAQLDATKEFSHHRAVALALEALRDPSAAGVLAELLSRDNMTGHAIADIDESSRQEQRSEPLREIILARALYRCGDHDGLAERILREYEGDLRALFAQHAQAVLGESR